LLSQEALALGTDGSIDAMPYRIDALQIRECPLGSGGPPPFNRLRQDTIETLTGDDSAEEPAAGGRLVRGAAAREREREDQRARTSPRELCKATARVSDEPAVEPETKVWLESHDDGASGGIAGGSRLTRERR
jgi:hypothetical protein